MQQEPTHTINFGNPNIFGLSAFGFSLFLLGMEMVVSRDIAGGALYGLLLAGILEFLAGMWMIAKGESYLASIMTIFGAWLICFFLLMTHGKTIGAFNGASAGWYMLAMEVPIAMLAIPAFVQKKGVLSAAFICLFALVFALGLGFILASTSWFFVSGICAFASAFFIWWLLWHNIHELLPH
jgi:succinate-acetate transporter protein